MASRGSDPTEQGTARCAAALRRNLGSTVPDAVAEAASELGQQPTLAIVHVSAPGDALAAGRALAHAGALIREIAADCVILGSNAHGVIGGDSSVEVAPAISIWMAHLPGAPPRPFRLAAVPAPHGGLALTGLPELQSHDRLAILLADPWTLPADAVVAAFTRVDGPLPVIGGLVSGGSRRGESRLLLDGAVFDNGGVGVVLDGAAPIRVVVSQGFRPVGQPMTVTASEGSTIHGLAGRPALERLREVVSSLDAEDQALAVRGLHVGIARDDGVEGVSAADYVIRGILGVDPTSGSISIGDDVAVGAVIRLQLRDADSADEDLRGVLELVQGTSPAAGAYVVTCNGRGNAMFTSSNHDAQLVRERLGTDAVGGFFAAGEIGPVGGGNHLHGFTAVIMLVDRASDRDNVRLVEVPREASLDGTDAGSPGAGSWDDELRHLLDPP
jgi:small ligand-binding sensory domain FIST